MRNFRHACLAFLLASSALAQDAAQDSTVPEGFVKIDGIGKLTVYAPDKATLKGEAKAQFMNGVRETYKMYESMYTTGLKQGQVFLGAKAGRTDAKDRSAVSLVVFPDRVALQTWL